MKEFIEKISGSGKRPVILVAPLDWGLGHATRCIPLIRYMIMLDCEVIIAGEGKQKHLLQQEFPGLRFVDLPGYRLKYSRVGWLTSLKILTQALKILTAIKQELGWLNNFLKVQKIDAIISDNRYGLYHTSVPSVLITHQLTIKTPVGKLGEGVLRKLHFRFIKRFSECWVPDFEGEKNLAGELSHLKTAPPFPVKYLGPLTRFVKKEEVLRYELIILLSGPEPQRTLLEEICVRELQDFQGPAVLVRGLPGDENPIPSFNQVIIYNHLPSEQLNRAINESKIVISRSGYSTVMDLFALNKRCIFIPTPGQTEQLYLAKYLSQQKYCMFFHQDNFSLKKALDFIKQHRHVPFDTEASDHYKTVLLSFIKNLFLKD